MNYEQHRDLLAQQGLRPCRICYEVYPLEEYNRDKRGNLGRGSVCRPCRNERERKRDHNPESFGYVGRLRTAKKRWDRAGKRTIPFTPKRLIEYLEKERHTHPLKCYYTGRQLQIEDRTDLETFLQLDHVKPMAQKRSTHSVGNVVPTSARFNNFKSNKRAVEAVLLAPEDLRAVCSYDGSAEGMAAVDKDGNPLVPAVVGWAEGSHRAIVVTVPLEDQ